MSNHLAIAAVTATIKLLLHRALLESMGGVSESPTATSVRPNSHTGLPACGVNVFLYQVTPNAAWRNCDAPTRRADRTLLQRPTLALDLHYLLTFHGVDEEFEPQRAMAIVAHALHVGPVLDKTDIAMAIKPSPLTNSDLADQIEPVRLTPTALSLEEMSKLWSVMLQTPYVLSMAYQASLVLIDKAEVVPAPLPVTKFTVTVAPIRRPRIDKVLVWDPARAMPVEGPVLYDSTLVLIGTELAGDQTWVRIGDHFVEVLTPPENEVQVSLQNLGLTPGVHSVQISQKTRVELNTYSQGGESQIFPFVVRPKSTFTLINAGAAIAAAIEGPLVGANRRVVLFLTEQGGASPKSYTIVLPKRDSDLSVLEFPIAGVERDKTYIVRIQVDGAESLLTTDANGMLIPTVALPPVVVPP